MTRPDRHLPATHPATVGAVSVLVVLAVLVTSACSQERGADRDEGSPPSTPLLEVPVVTIPPGFEASDTSDVVLAPFEAVPTVAPAGVEVLGGTARVTGAIVGPEGPVPGATVQLERFVGDQVGSIRVPAGPDGRFELTTLHGGRYRIRGWSAPSHTATRSAVAFIPADGEVVDLAIGVERHDAVHLTAGVEAGRFQVGDVATIRARLTREVVNGEGIVVDEPVPAAEVALTAPGLAVAAPSTNPARTAADGRVSWDVECRLPGSHRFTLAASAPAVELAVDAPACAPAADAEPRPTLPVGSRIQVPTAGPVPAGTYLTAGRGCVVSYELWVADGWDPQRRQSGGPTLVLPAPARALEPGGGGPGCSYQRVA